MLPRAASVGGFLHFRPTIVCRPLAHSVSYCGAATCPELGANWKSPAHSQTDAIDLEPPSARSQGGFSVAHARKIWDGPGLSADRSVSNAARCATSGTGSASSITGPAGAAKSASRPVSRVIRVRATPSNWLHLRKISQCDILVAVECANRSCLLTGLSSNAVTKNGVIQQTIQWMRQISHLGSLHPTILNGGIENEHEQTSSLQAPVPAGSGSHPSRRRLDTSAFSAIPRKLAPQSILFLLIC